jgi:uncharacterized protein (DUF885 family)
MLEISLLFCGRNVNKGVLQVGVQCGRSGCVSQAVQSSMQFKLLCAVFVRVLKQKWLENLMNAAHRHIKSSQCCVALPSSTHGLYLDFLRRAAVLLRCGVGALALCCAMPAVAQSQAVQPKTAQSPVAHTVAGSVNPLVSEITQLANRFFDESLAFNPIQGTFLGDARFHDRLPHVNAEQRAKQQALLQSTLTQANALAPKLTTPADQLTLAVLRETLQQRLELGKLELHLTPLSPTGSLPLLLAELGSGLGAQPFNTAQDYDAFVRRGQAFPRWVDETMADMREGMRRNITQPRVLIERMLPQLKALMDAPLEQSIFYRPVTNLPQALSAQEKERLTQQHRTLITNTLMPAYRKLHDFLSQDYLPKARTTSGLAGLPGGKEQYAKLIRQHTTLNMTAEQLHTLGKQEVERIHAEIAKVRDELGKQGAVNEFLKTVKEEPALYPFKTPQEIIAAFKAMQTRIDPELEKHFRLRPRAAMDIQTTPAFRAASASAQYMRPSEDRRRPGIFMFPVQDATRYSRLSMEALYLHEAIPGHHYQIALQGEMNLGRFRNNTSFTAYSEGWGLYAESLGKELGLYRDPYSYLGRLLLELHRANRLIVDTGLHHYGWTREQAMQQLIDTEGITQAQAANPIERYMANPGQALAYKVGELKIQELKQRAKTTLGNRYDPRDFHDQVLQDGGVPLNVLEQKIEAWMARVK